MLLPGTVVLFLLSGLIAGFVFQRSRLCFVSSVRDLLLFGATGMTRSILLLLTLTATAGALAVAWREQTGLPVPLLAGPSLPFTTVGGLAFGLGMVLAGSCAAGAFWRLGEGQWSQLWILAGLLAGTWFYKWIPWSTPMVAYAELPRWLSPAAFLLGLIALILWERRQQYQGEELPPTRPRRSWRAPWTPEAGAIVLAGALALFLGGTGQIWRVTRLFLLDDLASAGFALGLILGGLAGAALGQEWRSRTSSNWRHGALRFMGGLLMGVGARYGWGCTVGALLGGMVSPILYPWLWLAGAVTGAWIGASLLRRWVGTLL